MRTSILLVLAVLSLASGNILLGAAPTSSELLKDAIITAAKISDADIRAETLNNIVLAQARTGDFRGATDTAQTITVASQKKFAYGRIAEAQALAGDFAAAQALLDASDDASVKSNILRGMARAQIRRGDVNAAKVTAAKITDAFYLAHALREIALAQAAAGDIPAAKATIATITKPADVAVAAYVDLAALQAKANKTTEARETMALARSAASRAVGFTEILATAKIGEGEIKIGNSLSAKQMAERVTDPGDKALILNHIAHAQIEMGDFAGGKSTAAKLNEPEDKLFIYAQLASAQAKKGDRPDALRLLASCMQLLAQIKEPYLRVRAGQSIALAKAQVEDASVAAAWARSHADPAMRAAALLGVVEGLPNYQAPNK